MIILARRPAKAVVQRGIPKSIKPGLLKVPPPPKGKVKMITRDPNLPSGYGATSMYGEIEISSAGSANVSAAQLATEGAAVGGIVIGTMSFNVVFRPADRQNAK